MRNQRRLAKSVTTLRQRRKTETGIAGLVKCRLWHGEGRSIIVPDQIFTFSGNELRWHQPRTFSPPVLFTDNTDQFAMISVDVRGGESLLKIYASDYVQSFEDGSNLFRCFVETSSRLVHDGTAIRGNDRLLLRLYHHTAEDVTPKILESGHFLTSRWNFQGTKELVNIAYAYFTPLKKIETDIDLKRIAMASDGKIQLLLDDAPHPGPFVTRSAIESRIGVDILELDVYRSSTKARCASLAIDIDAALLAPQYLYLHKPTGQRAYYEVCNPFIQRIGVAAGATVPHDGAKITLAPNQCAATDYIVVGDATRLDGLRAPYDEEDTRFIMKLERIPAGQNILTFWFEHGNSDLFTSKPINSQVFK